MGVLYQISQVVNKHQNLEINILPPVTDIARASKQFRECLEIKMSYEVTDIAWFEHCIDWYTNLYSYPVSKNDIEFNFETKIHKVRAEKSNDLEFLMYLNNLLSCGDTKPSDFRISFNQYFI